MYQVFKKDTPVSDFQKEDTSASRESKTGVNARFQPKNSTPSCLTNKVIKVQSRIYPRAMKAFQMDPGANANQRNVSKGDFLAHSTPRVSCHAPWKGDHDGTLTEHTAEDTLDKSRRRDTMFPHSFCVTSVLL